MVATRVFPNMVWPDLCLFTASQYWCWGQWKERPIDWAKSGGCQLGGNSSSWGFKAKMLTTLAQCYHGITRTSGWSVGVWDTRACAGKLKKNTHFSTSCALMHAPASADVQQPGHWLWHKRILFDVWLPHPECIRSLMAFIDGQQREAITHVMDL